MSAARILRDAFFSVLLIALSPMSPAFGWGMSDGALQDLSFDATQQMLVGSVLRDARAHSRGTRPRVAKAPARSTLAQRAAGVSVARSLAARYPAERRAEAERHFQQLLQGYHRIEDRFGIPRYDVAGSVAAFLAGSLMAYRNEDFPDPHFKPLVAQMRGVIADNREFAKASPAARREMYEQLAILGMTMATTQMALKQQPDRRIAANMRRAAKGYLEQFLKADPDRVEITSQGLVIR
jgi:hypothetical protein